MEDATFKALIQGFGPWGISLAILYAIVVKCLETLKKAGDDFREELRLMRTHYEDERNMDRTVRHSVNEQLIAMLRTLDERRFKQQSNHEEHTTP